MNREQILKAAEHYSMVIEEVKGMRDLNEIEDYLDDEGALFGFCNYFEVNGGDFLAIAGYKPDVLFNGNFWFKTAYRALHRDRSKDEAINSLTVRRDFLLEIATKLETVSA